jgi:hypothetical protein
MLALDVVHVVKTPIVLMGAVYVTMVLLKIIQPVIVTRVLQTQRGSMVVVLVTTGILKTIQLGNAMY